MNGSSLQISPQLYLKIEQLAGGPDAPDEQFVSICRKIVNEGPQYSLLSGEQREQLVKSVLVIKMEMTTEYRELVNEALTDFHPIKEILENKDLTEEQRRNAIASLPKKQIQETSPPVKSGFLGSASWVITFMAVCLVVFAATFYYF